MSIEVAGRARIVTIGFNTPIHYRNINRHHKRPHEITSQVSFQMYTAAKYLSIKNQPDQKMVQIVFPLVLLYIIYALLSIECQF